MLRWFIKSAAVILSITAAAKFISASGHAGILLGFDPLTGIRFDHLFLLVAATEIIIALYCFLGKNSLLQSSMIAWLATSFIFYRIGLSLIGYHKPCPCLGNLTDALHISPQMANLAMRIILVYLLIGSYGCLACRWRQRQKKIQAESGQ